MLNTSKPCRKIHEKVIEMTGKSLKKLREDTFGIWNAKLDTIPEYFDTVNAEGEIQDATNPIFRQQNCTGNIYNDICVAAHNAGIDPGCLFSYYINSISKEFLCRDAKLYHDKDITNRIFSNMAQTNMTDRSFKMSVNESYGWRDLGACMSETIAYGFYILGDNLRGDPTIDDEEQRKSAQIFGQSNPYMIQKVNDNLCATIFPIGNFPKILLGVNFNNPYSSEDGTYDNLCISCEGILFGNCYGPIMDADDHDYGYNRKSFKTYNYHKNCDGPNFYGLYSLPITLRNLATMFYLGCVTKGREYTEEQTNLYNSAYEECTENTKD